MSDVISTLGNQRPRNQAWMARWVVRERRGTEGEGSTGMLMDVALRHWERRSPFSYWARVAEGAGRRGRGRLWLLKSRRLGKELCQCRVGAAREKQEGSVFESRLREPFL